MNHSAHNKLISFIWSIADDCLRDVYVRGKYRDVILPMVVLRRIDSLLEATKADVLAEVEFQKENELWGLDNDSLAKKSGYVFYNTSQWTLTSLKNSATNNPTILLANFNEYLNGFSENVREIIDRFNLRSQIEHMSGKDVLLAVLEKFVSPYINLTPNTVQDPDGNTLPALTNLGMGYVFEELIRKFNEENNEEAGEHFTPREVIELMTHLVFDPIKTEIPRTITVYDPACGSGGMLTEAQNFIEEKYPLENISRSIWLYGKEINDETYAICKSDMMIKGNDPQNIRVGSTLSTDEFQGSKFDFMLSNPPYGKSWANEQQYIKSGTEIIDPRFKVKLKDYWGTEEDADATPRSSDGQLLFLMEMADKMKSPSQNKIGSRVASVHNGSSLFTGDAGSGESNIRRYLIENDWLDAIVQLPNNLFYNTGITTYIWLLNNNKPVARQGKVQLIDASQLFRKLRKNLGNKNCEFSPEHISEIVDCYLNGTSPNEALQHKIFNNEDFGYYKVTIERPDRRKAQFSLDRIEPLRFDKTLFEPMAYLFEQHQQAVYSAENLANYADEISKWSEKNGIALNAKNKAKLLNVETWEKAKNLYEIAQRLTALLPQEYRNFNQFKADVEKQLKADGTKLSASEKNALFNAVSWYDETAEKVIAKTHKFKPQELTALCERLGCSADELVDFGYYINEKGDYVQYESNVDLRDSESVPLTQRIHDYFKAEVQPHIAESWINLESVKIGYEISFNKYFYRHQTLRTLAEVKADILALEAKADGLIGEILG